MWRELQLAAATSVAVRIYYYVYTETYFEWDESKNRRNRAKHGVSFHSAKLVFEDPNSITRHDRDLDGEQR